MMNGTNNNGGQGGRGAAMTAEHTPAPWVADDNEGFSSWSIWSRMAPSGHGTPGRKVAVVDDCSGHSDADAQLIAAAPELLDALKDMVEIFKNVPEEAIVNYDEPAEPKTQWDYDAFYVLGRARAAIRKATGAIQ